MSNIGGGKSRQSLVLGGLRASGFGRVFLPGLLLFLTSLVALAQTGGEAPGIPWTGSAGVTQTVMEIMAQDRNLPIQSSLQPRQSDEGRLIPNRKNLGQFGSSPRSSQSSSNSPSSGGETPLINTQNVGANFLAVQFGTESGFVPPDSMGAVGPSQVLVCVNGRIKVFDKTGVLGPLNTTTRTFFTSQQISSPSDPRVRYDRLSGRWFVVMIDVPHSGKDNKVLLAVSSGPTITSSSSFTFFSFVHSSPSGGGDSGWFADYPTLGIDNNALYIGANMFSGNTFTGTSAYVINKANLLAGTLTVTAFRQLASGTGAGPSTPQGVDNDDPSATEGYFIGVDNVSAGLLVVRRVSTPGGVPSISGNINLTVPDTITGNVDVPALGSSVNLDALDDRLFVARMHKGSLWTAHNFRVNQTGAADTFGGRVGSRWYEITNLAAAPMLRQSGTLFDSSLSNPTNYWIPSCMMNGQGHMVLGCSEAGVSEFAGIAVSGRYASDPLGTLQSPLVVQASSSAYNLSDSSNPHRWGDYSLTTVDPNDDMTFWTVQEYCSAVNTWGVRVIQIKAPPPAIPVSCSPSLLTAGAANVDMTVTGLSSNGSGFFDPGPGFPNHLSATVAGGGVTVNSLTFTDPTQLTLNLTISAGAANSGRTVMVTNPDGQTATSVLGILTIGGGTNHPPTIGNIADQVINEDGSISGLAFLVGDIETAAASLALSATSSNTNLVPLLNITFGGTGSNRTVNVVPAANQSGTATITVTVADLDGASATDSFLLTVASANDAPSFIKGANQTVLEDASPQTISNWATSLSAGPPNESSQSLNFIVTNNNNALFSAQPAVAPNGTLTYTPAPNVNGSATVTVQLHDDGGTANGGSDTSAPQIFTITVTPVNDPPSFNAGANQTVLEDAGTQTIGNWATALTAGPLNESSQGLNFTVTNNNNSLFAAQPAVSPSGILTYTPAANANGSASVAVQLHDDGGTANGGSDTSAPQTFTITVTPVNDPPSFTAGANQTVLEDARPQTVVAWATSVTAGPANESGQVLSFVVTNDNNTLFSEQPAITANGTLTYTPAPDSNGVANVTVLLHDDGGTENGGSDSSATQTFTITVTPVNDPPSLATIPDQMIDEGSTLVVIALATDVDSPAEALTFNLVGPPAGAAIDSMTGIFTWMPAEEQGPGTNTITVVVNDNGSPSMSATQTFMVTVREVNVAPVLTPMAAQMLVNQGATLTFTNHATDADLPANLLMYALSNAPPGAAINSASGVFTWTPAPEQVNTTNFITVVVTDDGLPPLSDAKIFTAIVLPPPVISSIIVSNGVVTLTWNAIVGTKYHVQFIPEFDDSSEWDDLGEPVTATDITATKTDENGLAAQRFYRIKVLP